MVILQRVKKAKCIVNNELINEINEGLLLYVGFKENDDFKTVDFLIKKIINLRIFEDEQNKMNLSIIDKKLQILSISQFTLYGDTNKGNRPSFKNSLQKDKALILYNYFNEHLNNYIVTKSGLFGANMQIESINDGPVTFIIKEKS